MEKVIEQYVLPILNSDGGSVEVMDMKEEGETTKVYIRYLGACLGCAASTTGTYEVISNTLRQKIDDSIAVELV